MLEGPTAGRIDRAAPARAGTAGLAANDIITTPAAVGPVPGRAEPPVIGRRGRDAPPWVAGLPLARHPPLEPKCPAPNEKGGARRRPTGRRSWRTHGPAVLPIVACVIPTPRTAVPAIAAKPARWPGSYLASGPVARLRSSDVGAVRPGCAGRRGVLELSDRDGVPSERPYSPPR